MKVLLDSCVSTSAAVELRKAGHDVATTDIFGADPGDRVILAFGLANTRTVVTIDKDFGELAVLHKQPHCEIIRLVDIPTAQQGGAAAEALANHGTELLGGAIVTVERSRVRIRSAHWPR
ncbi:MAG: DUF5615 family PIN-like protein [Phycisphaerales bacterium]|nr:DUF5615 family PIN-like protein [Phycisphaerales bacterium]